MYKKILIPVFILMLLLGLENMNTAAMETIGATSNVENETSGPSDLSSIWREQTYHMSQGTYIQQSPANSNHSDKEEIYLKGFTDTFKRDGLLMFDLNQYAQPNKNGLTLRLPIKDLDKKGVSYLPEYYFSLYVTNVNWNESEATWENMRDIADYRTHLLYDKIILTPENIGSYVDIDVSDAMQYTDDDGVLAFALIVDENPAGSNNGQNAGIKIYSKENASNPIGVPQLVRGEVYPVNIENSEFTVSLGEQPQLPASVSVEFSDGTFADIAVSWDAIDEALLSQENTFEHQGTLLGYPETTTAQITVIDSTPAKHVVNVEELEFTIKIGEYPLLPSTVKVEFSDGTLEDVLTQWEAIEESAIAKKGIFSIAGSLEDIVETATAKISVIELEAESKPVDGKLPLLSNPKTSASVAVNNEFIENPFAYLLDTETASLFNEEVIAQTDVYTNEAKTSTLKNYGNEEIESGNSSKNILVIGAALLAISTVMFIILAKKRKEKED